MKNIVLKRSLTVATILWICFIWGNSLLTGSESQGISILILNFANNLLANLGIDLRFTHYVIRKLAHFTEHAILGVLLFTMFGQYVEKVKDYIFKVLFFGLLIPVIDEFIQLFVDGRGGEIKDVIIDFSGVLTGVLITYIIRQIVNKRRNKKC